MLYSVFCVYVSYCRCALRLSSVFRAYGAEGGLCGRAAVCAAVRLTRPSQLDCAHAVSRHKAQHARSADCCRVER